MNTIWSINEQRPRERLFRLGPAGLSDIELLTAIIGSGSANDPACAIAARLLEKVQGSLLGLYRTHPGELMNTRGIGSARCTAILGGMELGRRMTLRSEEKGSCIISPNDAWSFIRERMPLDSCETILALHLDNRSHVLLCDEVAAKRRPAGCDLDMRRLARSCLMVNSAGVILAHNHPSGECSPSEQDVMLSLHVEAMLGCIGVELIDHLVTGNNTFTRVEWRSRGPVPLAHGFRSRRG